MHEKEIEEVRDFITKRDCKFIHEINKPRGSEDKFIFPYLQYYRWVSEPEFLPHSPFFSQALSGWRFAKLKPRINVQDDENPKGYTTTLIDDPRLERDAVGRLKTAKRTIKRKKTKRYATSGSIDFQLLQEKHANEEMNVAFWNKEQKERKECSRSEPNSSFV